MAPKKAGGKAAAKKDEAAAPEAQKRKADEEAPAAEAPAAKEAKVEEVEEQEKDAKDEKRACLKGEVEFNVADTTLNVVPALGGKVLASLSEGSLQSLIAGARANVGVKAGRYMFEVKILETSPLAGGKGAQKGAAMGLHNRSVLRVGFSTAASPLVLGAETEEHVYFDADGSYHVGGKREGAVRRAAREHTMAVVLNLDPKSPNKNTISLFVNGARAIQPQPLPEALQGKALFPHVSFRGLKVLCNWGPKPLTELPFSCHFVGHAATADAEVAKAEAPKGGKFEVVMPVGFPGEGTFDWLDGWLEKHPHFTELSDRKIVEWARISGHPAAKGWKSSNDRSEIKLGTLGEDPVHRIIRSIAGLMPRNYIVMEVKENLVQADRAATLRSFALPCYKKIAHVVMGEPSDEYKQIQHDKLLKDKQNKSDAKWKAAKLERQRKKEAAKRVAEIEAKKKAAAEEAAKKKAEAEAAKKAKEGEEEKMDVDEEKKAEEPEEKKAEEEEKKDEAAAEDEESEAEPPAVELTEEEKGKWFAPTGIPDLLPHVLNRWFPNFSIPEKAEGFDDVRFEWQPAAGSKEYLQNWIRDKKKTTRVEDLRVGQWFMETSKAFREKFAAWQAKQREYKESDAGKEAEEKKKKAEEAGESLDSATPDADILAVEDIMDVGAGEPLFKDFDHADWALLNLRFELLSLQAAFKKDVDDEDRPAIPEAHVAFYYKRYHNKQPNFKGYGVDNLQGLVKLIKDTVSLDGEVLTAVLESEADDFEALIKHTELNRRVRQRRLYAGDETARLKIMPDAMKSGGDVRAPGGGGFHGKGFGKAPRK